MTDVTHLPVDPSTTGPGSGQRSLQPVLHDLAVLVAAPSTLLSAMDGQVEEGGVQGWYAGDVRRVSGLVLSVEGSALEAVRHDVATTEHRVGYVARSLGDAIPDPTVLLDRRRTLSADRLEEQVSVTSTAQSDLEVVLHLDVGFDGASVATVKDGDPVPGLDPRAGTITSAPGADWSAPPGPLPHGGDGDRWTWRLLLRRGERATVGISVRLAEPPLAGGAFGAGAGAAWADRVRVGAHDPQLARTIERSLADLDGLLLRDGGDRFLAAGSPWFLTLFGRDTLWAARMLLPLDTGLALSTLRVLARRQGQRDDPSIEEQPGKILHEVRDPGLGHSLPPVYFGTVDATSLFVCTLADAHRWGADPEQVADLLPATRRCLEWQLAASAETGWLRYVDAHGRGLSNQGWKDSDDSVQHADGRLADAPIALCEVQAYAYQAAVRGAALLAAYDEPEVPGLLAWAADLRARFGPAFWVDDPDGGHPAIALDRDGRPVDALTSNVGHLLGTGLLDAGHSARVADLLSGPELASGFGVRTLSTASPRFSPLSYHGGSVWPHDTAIAITGLAADGAHDAAGRLAADLLGAAPSFGHRFPELYGGEAATDVAAPSAYPAACRPQAWSAAGAVAALVAATGLVVDVPAGTVAVPERVGPWLRGFRITGLRAGTTELAVAVDADGRVAVELGQGSGLRVVRR